MQSPSMAALDTLAWNAGAIMAIVMTMTGHAVNNHDALLLFAPPNVVRKLN